jgi:hypothetical protein
LVDLDGGIATNIFESTAFESTAFQTEGVTEYFHVTEAEYDKLEADAAVLSTAIDATLTGEYATVIVTASAKTMTLPKATVAFYGREWTIVQNVTGYVDIEPNVADSFILPGGSDTIRLDQIGSTLTVRCISTTQWVIV